MKLSLPPFLPDQNANAGGLSEAENVVPTADGYGPVQAFSGFTAGLPAAFKGGASFIAADGTSSLLVGTATGLVKYANPTTWTALASGMTVPGQWRFAQFGSYAIGVNGVATKVVNLSSLATSTLAGAPIGVCIAVVGDFVVIGQNSSDLLGIYTSAFNDHTGWTPGVNQSTIQPMLTGGEVMGLAGGEYGVILQRQRLVRMTRTGDPLAPFQYDQITDNFGCASKASIAVAGRSVFFLSDRGFMSCEDGQAVKPIGSEKVDRTFQAEVPRDDYERIFAAVDPQNKLVIWCVPGSPGKLWIYNFALDRWSTAKLPIDGVFAGFTSSVSLETLAATYTNVDTMTVSLDDPRWAGGNPRLYAVQSSAVGSFFGDNLKASFQYGFNDLARGRVARLRAIRPVTDAISGHTLTVDCRARMGDAANAVQATALRNSGTIPVRKSGRYTKLRWEIAASTLWSFAQGLEIDMAAGGER